MGISQNIVNLKQAFTFECVYIQFKRGKTVVLYIIFDSNLIDVISAAKNRAETEEICLSKYCFKIFF